MTSSATLIKSGTLGVAAKSPGERTTPNAQAREPAPRRRLPLWILALGGAAAAAAYALVVERMHFGPPLVMFTLGGMTLALTGAALLRVIDPLAGNSPAATFTLRGGRRPRELEREKQLVLKAIKEIELDYQMRKIAERDYREMVERYRTRAMRLMSEIEAGDDFRVLIERELTMRLKLDAAKPVTAAVKAPESPAPAPVFTSLSTSTCVACSTVNDDDARFCKKCGAKLSPS
jgi:hypothetical protein